ncbi:MAG: Xaa-Pro peptidase family protein [Candidatus Aminicenantaceae bacterium]
MWKRHLMKSGILFLLCGLLSPVWLQAQRSGYSREEFERRRTALMEAAEEGMIVLFGDAEPQPGAHFRQDNDFFYFTGVEDLNAILLLAPRTGESHLFLPRQTPREEMIEGPNLLKDPEAGSRTGFSAVHPLSYFDEFLARRARQFGLTFHLRLSPRDTIDNARWETRIFAGRKNRTHYNDQVSLDEYRIRKLRDRYAMCDFMDVTPHIDRMRLIKTPEEIEILRRNGRISAAAVKAAIQGTRPGAYEYEIEAEAVHVILKRGARGTAYPPIVGSGPNSCIWHYDRNDRRIEEGDLVLMDFGADLDHLCMDISRTWPASGRFTPEQREVYQTVLEVQKACIAAYRPGVTVEQVRAHVTLVLKQKGLDPRGLRGGFGHHVGLATHDVSHSGPLQEGMVFAIEPGLYYPEQNIGIRIEDTVLITRDGCEVLTREVPKEIEEIERLMAERK